MKDNCVGVSEMRSQSSTKENKAAAKTASASLSESTGRTVPPVGDVNTESESGQNSAQHFVSRNIKLACEGQGTGSLALTEEERERLDRLLDEIPEHSAYAPSGDTRQSMQDIDYRLQALSVVASVRPDSPRSELDCHGLTRWELDCHGLTRSRINEINRTLTALRQTINQEIEPLDEENMQFLIGQYITQQPPNSSKPVVHGDVSSSVVSAQSAISPRDCDCQSNQGVISRLVQDARTNMPLFKFKHAQHSANATSAAN